MNWRIKIFSKLKKAFSSVCLTEKQSAYLFFFGLTIFCGNFLFARLFAVYDDDFMYLPAFSWTWEEAWAQVYQDFITWPQGRPLAYGLGHLIFFLTAKTQSLGLSYLTGFLFLLLNAILLNRLVRPFLSNVASLLAVTVFILYPADTSKIILMMRVFAQLNLTFLLVALLMYVRGWRWQSYLVAALCFMTYEPTFLPFLLAPLLVSTFREVSWRRVLQHILICGGIMMLLLVLRSHLGDPRLCKTIDSPLEAISRICQALWIGPRVALTALLLRPLEALIRTDPILWVVVLLCSGAFYLLSCYLEKKEGEDHQARPVSSLPWIATVGAVGLLLGYALCFTEDYWPPIMTIGRISGYHATGAVGASLLVGALFGLALEKLPRLRPCLIVGAAAFCGLLVSFGVEVQRIDYIKHADQQSRFWRTVLETSAEWKPDTVIMVDISGDDPSRPFTPGMPLWWTVNFAPLILEHLVDWPAEWEVITPAGSPRALKYPRAYGFLESMETVWEGDVLTIKTPAWLGSPWWPRIRDGQFILFRFVGGRMVRASEPIKLGGRYIMPMGRATEDGVSLPQSRVFRLLFEKETNWRTIQKAKNYPR